MFDIRFVLGARAQFLWPFQTFHDSKGRHSPFGIDFEALENDEPAVSAFNLHDLTQANENVTVLGEGSRDSVKFEWMITPWTECSQTCGSDFGYRVSINWFGELGRLQIVDWYDQIDQVQQIHAIIAVSLCLR